jgi:hypothetical protein
VKTIIYTAASLLLTVLVFSCKKSDEKHSGIVKIQINHTVDGKPLVLDTLDYRNEAGNIYRIERLQYFLSDLRFYGNRQLVAHVDTVIYVDARTPEKCLFTLQDFPFRYVDSVSFLIGVTPKYNVTGRLSSTMETAAMDWPQMMGGGYHFLKLEGRWADNSQTPGFAAHLGKQGYQVSAGMHCAYLPGKHVSDPLVMTMNVNEWFRSPHQYDFSKDGVYSMGDEALMLKLKENGTDAFLQK